MGHLTEYYISSGNKNSQLKLMGRFTRIKTYTSLTYIYYSIKWENKGALHKDEHLRITDA